VSLSAEAILRNTQKPVPRYTSYPTAPHFHAGVDAAVYGRWLEELPAQAAISLYVHVPFCDTLCWFCGCHTKITRRYEPVARYLNALKAEIDLIARLVPASARLTHLHWGGGSPTILTADDSESLIAHINSRFQLGSGFEFAVEVDPRGMDNERIDRLSANGLTRVSVGVQDFDPAVQKAINRIQTVEETRAVIERFRANGVKSLNIDAIYGLPGQYAEQLQQTLQEVVRLDPDRIALFGYAHVPWMKKHQGMIAEADLPGVLERHAHAEGAAGFLERAGFERIGLDHFAKPQDALSAAAREGRLQRNFQGYTVDPADALIGLGASAIGKLPQGYVQNEPAIHAYEQQVLAGTPATQRGIALALDDRIRSEAIERLMCDLAISASPFSARYGKAAAPVIKAIETALAEDSDGLLAAEPDGFRMSEKGRAFTRVVAARFDAFLGKRQAGHSLAV
jgi:oxygen-independent coproporphyrinogen III oxidase